MFFWNNSFHLMPTVPAKLKDSETSQAKSPVPVKLEGQKKSFLITKCAFVAFKLIKMCKKIIHYYKISIFIDWANLFRNFKSVLGAFTIK